MASNVMIGATGTAQNVINIKLPLGAAGTTYQVAPTYPNAILGGCCNGADTTCAISGLSTATGAAITELIANASCIWARTVGSSPGTGALKPFFISELGPDKCVRFRVRARRRCSSRR